MRARVPPCPLTRKSSVEAESHNEIESAFHVGAALDDRLYIAKLVDHGSGGHTDGMDGVRSVQRAAHQQRDLPESSLRPDGHGA